MSLWTVKIPTSRNATTFGVLLYALGLLPTRPLDGPSGRASREVLFKLYSVNPRIPERNSMAEGPLGLPPCLQPGLLLFSCLIWLFEYCCFGGRSWPVQFLDPFYLLHLTHEGTSFKVSFFSSQYCHYWNETKIGILSSQLWHRMGKGLGGRQVSWRDGLVSSHRHRTIARTSSFDSHPAGTALLHRNCWVGLYVRQFLFSIDSQPQQVTW